MPVWCSIASMRYAVVVASADAVSAKSCAATVLACPSTVASAAAATTTTTTAAAAAAAAAATAAAAAVAAAVPVAATATDATATDITDCRSYAFRMRTHTHAGDRVDCTTALSEDLWHVQPVPYALPDLLQIALLATCIRCHILPSVLSA